MIQDIEKIIRLNENTTQEPKMGSLTVDKALKKILHKFTTENFSVPGKAIKESVLSKEFNINRTAIREALSWLARWGIVEYVPYCGYRLKHFSLRNFLEWHELREALEPIAARRVARFHLKKVIKELEGYLDCYESTSDPEVQNSADLNFHLTIISNCENQQFITLYNAALLAAAFSLNNPCLFYNTSPDLQKKYSVEDYLHRNVSSTGVKHRQMLDAIKEGNEVEAEELFRAHAKAQVKNYENLIAHYGDLDFAELRTYTGGSH